MMRALAIALASSILAGAKVYEEPRIVAGPADARAKANQIVGKMRTLEKISSAGRAGKRARGTLDVNGPLPKDFKDQFSQAVSLATGCAKGDVTVVSAGPLVALLQLEVGAEIDEITFEAPEKVVHDIQDQASDPDSPLASGPLHSFLVEKPAAAGSSADAAKADDDDDESARSDVAPAAEPCEDDHSIDIDTAMPYGELEPFGREDTAQELTEQSITESDMMVDQLERAEVAEEKRAVFRALTRLRGAAITSFDGIARSQTGNIDEYNKVHQWRRTHPLHHLADEESDISKWAFPDNADFVQLGK